LQSYSGYVTVVHKYFTFTEKVLFHVDSKFNSAHDGSAGNCKIF